MKNIELYDYQELMLHRIEEELAKRSGIRISDHRRRNVWLGRTVMVQMPTGTGKTYVMAAVIRNVKVDGEVWIIAHRRELVEQMERTLDKFDLEYEEAKSVKDWKPARIRVMSIQWLTRHIRDVETEPALIIIDEAHHAIAPSYQELWTYFPLAQRIGFTATPCRMKLTNFTKLFDELLQTWSIDQFIRAGRLSLYDYIVINKLSDEQHTIDGFEKRGTDGDYSVTEMDEKMNKEPKISRLYESLERYAHGKKGIVYAINIHHAKNIADYYSQRGIKAVAIDSKTPSAQRAQIVNDFREGRIDCMVNVNLFDEGFDCPDVEYIKMARPTLSLAKYLQMVGRGLRVHSEKKMCVLLDNVGLYRMFGLPNATHDWEDMFHGYIAGHGKLERRRKQNTYEENNEMEIVAQHSLAIKENEYVESIVPFEHNGRWGLRSGDTIILRPMYQKIEPFVGDYCAYMLAPHRWGVLRKSGRVCVSPEYQKVKILPDGYAIITSSAMLVERVRLR